MTFIYVTIILLQIAVIVYFVNRSRKAGTRAKINFTGDAFADKRKLLLNITPLQLKLAIPEERTLVYGVIMDWNIGNGVVTLGAYITGAASMYMSSGGGFPGGGKDPNVAEVASEFVVAAQDFLERSVPTANMGLPPVECVRFYFLSNKGLFALQEAVRYFDDGSSAMFGLFRKANEVITEMRLGSINN